MVPKTIKTICARAVLDSFSATGAIVAASMATPSAGVAASGEDGRLSVTAGTTAAASGGDNIGDSFPTRTHWISLSQHESVFHGFFCDLSSRRGERNVVQREETKPAALMIGGSQEGFLPFWASGLRRKARTVATSRAAAEATEPTVLTPALNVRCHSVAASHRLINCERLSSLSATSISLRNCSGFTRGTFPNMRDPFSIDRGLPEEFPNCAEELPGNGIEKQRLRCKAPSMSAGPRSGKATRAGRPGRR